MRSLLLSLSLLAATCALRIHMIGLFHTITSDEYSHCAFTGKVLRFARMMQPLDHHVIEYGNAESQSQAMEFHQVLSREELLSLLPIRKESEFYAKTAVIGSPVHKEYEKRLFPLLLSHVLPGDIICHPFGHSHETLSQLLPEALHVECGIGYLKTWAPYRIFESHSKLHYSLGYEQSSGRQYDFVIPNYFDGEDWPADYTLREDKPLVFMGRISSEKGMSVIQSLARELPHQRFLMAGQGNFQEYFQDLPNVQYHPPLKGKERSTFLRGALAMLMPTLYVEPFGGSGVEAQMSGVPLLASHFGAFSETIEHGKTGFLCRTIGDWLYAIRQAEHLDRHYIATRARRLYDMPSVAPLYDTAFRVIHQVYKDQGWNNITSLQRAGAFRFV